MWTLLRPPQMGESVGWKLGRRLPHLVVLLGRGAVVVVDAGLGTLFYAAWVVMAPMGWPRWRMMVDPGPPWGNGLNLGWPDDVAELVVVGAACSGPEHPAMLQVEVAEVPRVLVHTCGRR